MSQAQNLAYLVLSFFFMFGILATNIAVRYQTISLWEGLLGTSIFLCGLICALFGYWLTGSKQTAKTEN